MAETSAGPALPGPGRRPGLLVTVIAVLAAVLQASGLPAEQGPHPLQGLLHRSDIGGSAPASFRARMRLASSVRPEPLEIEVWRAAERTLVRFLGAKQRGKYLLYLPGNLWFLSPDAKKPVKLPRSFRLQGSATLDDLLGVSYSRDYSISRADEGADEVGPFVRFHLAGSKPGMQYPAVVYVVRPESSRPVSAEFRLKSGKPATSIEFVTWLPGRRLQPRLLLLRDRLHGGGTTRVEVLSFEEHVGPEGLFDLASGDARRQLEEQTPDESR